MAVSTANLLEEMSFSPQLKWPNDVLLNKQKIAGILGETVSFQNCAGIAMGIGINVNMPKSLCNTIDQATSSLFVESGKIWDRETIAFRLANSYLKDLQEYNEKGFHPFLSEIERLDFCKGKEILLEDKENTWRGKYLSISSEGGIRMQIDQEEVKTFYSGKIRPLDTKQ